MLWLIAKFGQCSQVVFHMLSAFVLCLTRKNRMNTEIIDYKEKTLTLVRSSMMLCCSRTWSFRKATSCSSCAWSRSFKDFSFFNGGWELIFSLCSTPTEKRDHNISRWADKNNNTRDSSVLTISRFSFAKPLSFSSIFWIVWVKSSFLLFSSLFLSSRGLHCFSDSRTRFS